MDPAVVRVRTRCQLAPGAHPVHGLGLAPGTLPSGLRLGAQELTRVGMGVDEMKDVARFYSRVLIDKEDPSSVKSDVKEFKSEYQTIRYCFNEDELSGYPL